MKFDTAVYCDQLRKEYRSAEQTVLALSGVNLTIAGGEILMLVGPSGCGKTTLISVIAGTLRSDGGSCNVFGEDLNRLSEEELDNFRKKDVGFVFQAYNLIPTLTASENVAIPLLLGGMDFYAACKRAEETLELVGLYEKRSVLPINLSGGQNQRVALARAIVHRPRLIVCDEPTSALDAETGQLVMEVICRLAKERSTTLIIVTHDNRIFHFADRIVKMNDGRIVE
ncbi:MAG TPA: ABC transporter ATP-binding protein [Oligoflexia bacterium]|nr:ABC transporter ATP-binding protein [Oligoflexia bacterium]HMP27221.1 ABC transporter ATP-binding protein [Oligoflexia bacterium]